MLKYLYRTCPKCKDYMGVVVPDPPGPMSEIPIDAHCVVCGFKLGWKLVLGKRSSSKSTKLALFFLVFSIFACSRQAEADWRLVTRVVDGDTIIVGARERVRLIGVDTPCACGERALGQRPSAQPHCLALRQSRCKTEAA